MIKQCVACNSVGDENTAGATDKAMLQLLVTKWGVSLEKERKAYLGDPMIRFQFDSTRKRMSTIIEDSEAPNGKRLMIKGAADVLVDYCTHYLTKDGAEQEITDGMRNELKSVQEVMAKKALRNIVWAYREIKQGDGGEFHDDKSPDHPHLYELEEVRDGQKGFTLISIAGIMDIIRDTVPSAVEDCKRAGVRVRMVTGDSIVTAIAIAKMCGIIEKDWQETPDQHTCMTGKQFDEFVGGLVDKKTGEKVAV